MNRIFFAMCLLMLSMYSHASSSLNALKGGVNSIAKLTVDELSIGARNSSGQNYLAGAISRSNVDVASYLIHHNIGLEVKDYFGRSPIFIAVMNSKRINVVDSLIERKVYPHGQDTSGRSLIDYAKRTRNKKLLDKIVHYIQSYPHPTAKEIIKVRSFIHKGDYSSLKSFFDKFHSIEFLSKNGKPVILELIQSKALHKISLKTFIQMGVGVNMKDSVVGSALSFAIQSGDVISARALLSEFARPDYQDKNGKTALMHALESDFPESFVTKIIKRSVDINLLDHSGKSALHYLAGSKYSSLVDEFIVKKATFDILDNDGVAPIHIAAIEGDKTFIISAVTRGGAGTSIQNRKKEDVATILAKKHPRKYLAVRATLKQNGYPSTQTNANNKTASDIWIENNPELVEIDKIEFKDIPSAGGPVSEDINLENPTDSMHEYDIELADKYKGIKSLTLHYVYEYFTRAKMAILSKLENELGQLLPANDSIALNNSVKGQVTLKGKMDKVQNGIIESRRKLSEAQAHYSQFASKYNTNISSSQGDIEKLEESYLNLVVVSKEYISFVNSTTSMFNELSLNEKDLQSVIKRFESGESEVHKKLNDLDIQFEEEKKGQSNLIKAVKASYSEKISISEQKLTEYKSKERTARSAYDNTLKQITSLNNQIKSSRTLLANIRRTHYQADGLIKRSSYRFCNDIFGEQFSCTFLKEIKRINKSVASMVKKKSRLDSSLIEINKTRNKFNSQIATTTSRFEKIRSQYLQDQTEDISSLNDSFIDIKNEYKSKKSSLTIDVREEYKKLKNHYSDLFKKLEDEVGDLNHINSFLSEIQSFASRLSSGQFDGSFGALLGTYLSLIDGLDSAKEKGHVAVYLTNEFDPIRDRLLKSYSSYKRLEMRTSISKTILFSVRSMHDDVKTLQNQLQDLLDKRSSLKSNLLDSSSKVDEKNLDHPNIAEVRSEYLIVKKLVDLQVDILYSRLSGDYDLQSELLANLSLISNKKLKYFSKYINFDFSKYLFSHMRVKYVQSSISISDFTHSKANQEILLEASPQKEIFLSSWFRLILDRFDNFSISQELFGSIFVNSFDTPFSISKLIVNKKEAGFKVFSEDGAYILESDGSLKGVDAGLSSFEIEITSSGPEGELLRRLVAKVKSRYSKPIVEMSDDEKHLVAYYLNLIRTADLLDDLAMKREMASYISDGIMIYADITKNPVLGISAGIAGCFFENPTIDHAMANVVPVIIGCVMNSSLSVLHIAPIGIAAPMTKYLGKILTSYMSGGKAKKKTVRAILLAIGGKIDNRFFKLLNPYVQTLSSKIEPNMSESLRTFFDIKKSSLDSQILSNQVASEVFGGHVKLYDIVTKDNNFYVELRGPKVSIFAKLASLELTSISEYLKTLNIPLESRGAFSIVRHIKLSDVKGLKFAVLNSTGCFIQLKGENGL
ncbi:MAG: hypothetical protein KAG61_11690 [Bacteriovoracaceae bacterium]|nr:hypothetical protein [Bacteriovoracaceae bacterium]